MKKKQKKVTIVLTYNQADVLEEILYEMRDSIFFKKEYLSVIRQLQDKLWEILEK